MKFIILLLIVLTGCTNNSNNVPNPKYTKYDMICLNIMRGLDRCESLEVICYIVNAQGLQCKFKEYK